MNTNRAGLSPAAKRRWAEARKEWARLRSLGGAEIAGGIAADADAKPTDTALWQSAPVRMPERKESITIRLDADVLRWFRRRKGYQTRINAVLRAYMEANLGRDED